MPLSHVAFQPFINNALPSLTSNTAIPSASRSQLLPINSSSTFPSSTLQSLVGEVEASVIRQGSIPLHSSTQLMAFALKLNDPFCHFDELVKELHALDPQILHFLCCCIASEKTAFKNTPAHAKALVEANPRVLLQILNEENRTVIEELIADLCVNRSFLPEEPYSNFKYTLTPHSLSSAVVAGYSKITSEFIGKEISHLNLAEAKADPVETFEKISCGPKSSASDLFKIAQACVREHPTEMLTPLYTSLSQVGHPIHDRIPELLLLATVKTLFIDPQSVEEGLKEKLCAFLEQHLKITFTPSEWDRFTSSEHTTQRKKDLLLKLFPNRKNNEVFQWLFLDMLSILKNELQLLQETTGSLTDNFFSLKAGEWIPFLANQDPTAVKTSFRSLLSHHFHHDSNALTLGETAHQWILSIQNNPTLLSSLLTEVAQNPSGAEGLANTVDLWLVQLLQHNPTLAQRLFELILGHNKAGNILGQNIKKWMPLIQDHERFFSYFFHLIAQNPHSAPGFIKNIPDWKELPLNRREIWHSTLRTLAHTAPYALGDSFTDWVPLFVNDSYDVEFLINLFPSLKYVKITAPEWISIAGSNRILFLSLLEKRTVATQFAETVGIWLPTIKEDANLHPALLRFLLPKNSNSLANHIQDWLGFVIEDTQFLEDFFLNPYQSGSDMLALAGKLDRWALPLLTHHQEKILFASLGKIAAECPFELSRQTPFLLLNLLPKNRKNTLDLLLTMAQDRHAARQLIDVYEESLRKNLYSAEIEALNIEFRKTLRPHTQKR